LRDVAVRELGEHPPLVEEARDEVGVLRDRGEHRLHDAQLLEARRAREPGQPHRAHAAFAELLEELISSEVSCWRHAVFLRCATRVIANAPRPSSATTATQASSVRLFLK